MTFDLDCKDRGEPMPAVSATAAQLVRLTAVAEGLGPDELAVLLLMVQRLTKGRGQYGTLDVAHDARCFRVEALEEAADGLVYGAAALMRGEQS